MNPAPALSPPKKSKRPSFFEWSESAFSKKFVARYLTELLELDIIDATEKALIEGEQWFAPRWLKIPRPGMDNLAVHFPALFKVTDEAELDSFNRALQQRLASHNPRILPLGDFIDLMNGLVLSNESVAEEIEGQWVIRSPQSESHYQLLSCYTEIFASYTSRSKRLTPLVLKKSVEAGQAGLATWCIHTLNEARFDFNGWSRKQSRVLTMVFECLKNQAALSQNNAELGLLLENGEVVVQKLLLVEAIPSTRSLKAMLNWLAGFKPNVPEPGELSDLSVALQQRAASFFATLLLIDPLLPISNRLLSFIKKNTYWQGMIGAMLRGESSIPNVLRYDESIFNAPSGFYKEAFGHFLPRYKALAREKQGLATEKTASQLLDWLDAEAVEEEAGMRASVKAVSPLLLELINAGVGLSYVDKQKMTLLHKAAHLRQIKLVRSLLQTGLEVNASSSGGLTPLHLAVREDRRPVNNELIQLLVEHPKTELIPSDNHGWTPLHYLAKLENASLLDFFLRIVSAKEYQDFLDAETSWRLPAPSKYNGLFIIARWSKFFIEPRFWRTHRQTALQIADSHRLDQVRDRLLHYNEVICTKAWSLPNRPEQQRYMGRVPGSQEVFHFIENEVEGNGDCAFLALEVTREEVERELMACVSEDACREALAPEIVNALIERRVGGAGIGDFLLPEGEALYEEYARRESVVDVYIRRLDNERIATYRDKNPALEEKDIPPLPRAEWPLHLASSPDLLQEFNALQEASTEALNQLGAYAARKEVYTAYVSSIKQDLYLGYSSILLYAKQVNWRVYIWRAGDLNVRESELVVADFYETPNPSRTVHLLHTGMYNHFNRLEKLSLAEVVPHKTSEGFSFSVKTPKGAVSDSQVAPLYAAIQQIGMVKTPGMTEVNEAAKEALLKEKVALQSILSGLLENQEAQKAAVDARLSRIESLLEENLVISHRYDQEVAPYPLRRQYYHRVRAEVAANFSAVLLLTTKLIQPWGGKLDDATASRSTVDAFLNISVLSSEAMEPVMEGATFLAEHAETVFRLIKAGAKIGAEQLKYASYALPVAGVGLSIFGGAVWLAEFYSELKKIEHGHHALNDLSPKDVEQLAEKIALIMTDRAKDVLEFLTVEGLLQLAFFDYRRLLMGLLQGEFKQSLPLEAIIDRLCEYKVKQGRLLFRIPLTGKVALRKDKVVEWIKTHYDLTVEESQIPDTLNENWLHHGVEIMIGKLCKQQGIAIQNQEKQSSNTLSALEAQKESSNILSQLTKAPKTAELQPSSNVREWTSFYNRLSALERESALVQPLPKKITELKNELTIKIKALGEEKIRLEEEIKDLKLVSNQKLDVLEKEKIWLEEEITNLREEIKNAREEKNTLHYLRGQENYQRGKEHYRFSLNKAVSLEDRMLYSSKALFFFSNAEKALQKVDRTSLEKENAEKVVKLNNTLAKCARYFKPHKPQVHEPAPNKVITLNDLMEPKRGPQ